MVLLLLWLMLHWFTTSVLGIHWLGEKSVLVILKRSLSRDTGPNQGNIKKVAS